MALLNDIEMLSNESIGSACHCPSTPCVFVKSDDLCERLRSLIESPWRDIELTPSKLGRRLADNFRIRTRHSTDKSQRGYHLSDFMDSFSRYPRPKASKASDTPSDQHEQDNDQDVPKAAAKVSDADDAENPECVWHQRHRGPGHPGRLGVHGGDTS